MKKLISVVICLTLMASFFIAVYAQTIDAIVTISTVEGQIKAGNEVVIPISISKWENAYAVIELELEFNESVLKLEDIEPSKTDFVGALTSVNGKRYSVLCNPTSENQGTNFSGGEVCLVKFKANKDINVSTNVTVNAVINGYTKGKVDGWTDYRQLSLNVVKGGVYVEGTVPEDPKPIPANPNNIVPGGTTGDTSAVGVAGIICLVAAIIVYFLYKKKG